MHNQRKTQLPPITAANLSDLFISAIPIPVNLSERTAKLTTFLDELNDELLDRIDDDTARFIAYSRVSIAATVLIKQHKVLNTLGAVSSENNSHDLTIHDGFYTALAKAPVTLITHANSNDGEITYDQRVTISLIKREVHASANPH